MRLLSKRKMTNEGSKHNNIANKLLSIRTTQMRLLSTRAMTNEVAKHHNNENKVLSTITMADKNAKYKNNGR